MQEEFQQLKTAILNLIQIFNARMADKAHQISELSAQVQALSVQVSALQAQIAGVVQPDVTAADLTALTDQVKQAAVDASSPSTLTAPAPGPTDVHPAFVS